MVDSASLKEAFPRVFALATDKDGFIAKFGKWERTVWAWRVKLRRPSIGKGMALGSWVGSIPKPSYGRAWGVLFNAVIWTIWESRNNVVFRDIMTNSSQAMEMVKFRMAWWFKHHGSGSIEMLTDMLFNIKGLCVDFEKAFLIVFLLLCFVTFGCIAWLLFAFPVLWVSGLLLHNIPMALFSFLLGLFVFHFACLVIDDTYDSYGTFAELRLFNDSVQRWDVSALDDLPDYMKIIYRTLLNLFEEIYNNLSEEENTFKFSYTKDTMKEMAAAYFAEAKWLYQTYVPPFDEYMIYALISLGSFSYTAAKNLGMEKEIAGINAFEWLQSRPKILTAAYVIARLKNDLIGHTYNCNFNKLD
ncbi:hypothetical protein Ddye_027998 [Dipteronia dyeriana]|uniref:Terpene synthase metal-binding domain-containing protein n=1 Tax=Dipteronia dyeriana TaxID=168575 RepID=A0AAD9WRZ1_9ROSI|nr:hypothetical protein Ddye_027998 [Dipteronia dyeriana]